MNNRETVKEGAGLRSAVSMRDYFSIKKYSQLYRKHGYRMAAGVPHYCSENDNKVILMKNVCENQEREYDKTL